MGHHKKEAMEKQDTRRFKRDKSKSKSPGFRGFVSHSLTAKDKQEYKQFETTEDFEGELLPELLNEGYRISFSADARTGAYQASISTKDEQSVNSGLVLTARAGDSPFRAGLRACFLHQVVFGEVWPDPSLQQEYEDEWLE